MPSTFLETEIVIDKAPEVVKSVFMDWSRYPEWNPFMTSLSLVKGDIDNPSTTFSQLNVIINLEDSKPMKFTPQLLVNSANEFRWTMERRFVHGERFTGLGVGLFKLMVSVDKTRKGFIAMNEALKKEVEGKTQ